MTATQIAEQAHADRDPRALGDVHEDAFPFVEPLQRAALVCISCQRLYAPGESVQKIDWQVS